MIRRVVFFSLAFLALFGSPASAQEEKALARIGVLAYRGSEQLAQHWSALSAYLELSVEGWRFELEPVSLVSAAERLESGEIMFLVTNPGHFVELDRQFPLSVLASRLKRLSNGALAAEFGGAIIVSANSPIQSLRDVTGTRVLAVDPEAFGGFQLAWRSFERAGIDLFRDTDVLEITGFPMDQIVTRIAAGEAEVGLVRSGLVEAMIAEGRVAPDSIRFLNLNTSYRHGEAVSTRLYPEWPFAAIAATPRSLRDRVALALLSAQGSKAARIAGLRDMWSAPVSYDSVADLTRAYAASRARPVSAQPLNIALISVFAGVMALALIFAIRRRNSTPAPVAGPNDQAAQTTPREREVLDLIAAGHSTKEIARLLGVSPKTVEYHRANLLRKFGARTSSQLVANST